MSKEFWKWVWEDLKYGIKEDLMFQLAAGSLLFIVVLVGLMWWAGILNGSALLAGAAAALSLGWLTSGR